MSGGGGFGLGSIGSTLGKVAGSALKPVNIAGSAIGSMGGVGSVLGPALQLAGGASPLGVFGSSLAGEVLKGYTEKGGSADKPVFVDAAGNPIYAQRGYNYGANTYKVSNNPFDASKYFISGDKGVYNLLPMMGSLYGDKKFAAQPGTASYNIYQSIYDKMADDAAAQKAFSERFGVKEINPMDYMSRDQRQAYTQGITPSLMAKTRFLPNSGAARNLGFGQRGPITNIGFGQMSPIARLNNPQYGIFGDSLFNTRELQRANIPSYLADDLNRAFGEYNPLSSFKNTTRRGQTFQAPTINPIKYVDFGFGADATSKKQPYELLADYASKNKNPFFLAYAPETPAPAPAPAAPQPSPTGMKAGGLVALAKKR